MKALTPIHRLVASELALGFKLQEICAVRQLDLESWRRITNGKVFQVEVKKLGEAIEEQLIQDAGDDPALQKLKAAKMTAVNRLIDETDNFDEDASASTRIQASTQILDRTGIGKKQEDRVPAVVINIQGAKADMLSEMKLAVVAVPENHIVKAAVDND